MKFLTSNAVIELFPDSTTRTYPPGQIVVYQGDQPSHVLYVKKGALKHYDIDEDGNEKIMQIIGESFFIPMPYTVGERSEVFYFYASMCDVELILVPLDDFRAKLKSSTDFAEKIIKSLVYEMDDGLLRIKSLEKNDAKQKVIQTLEYLRLRHGDKSATGWWRVRFPVSQQIIADMTGLSRETVNLACKDLETQKIMRTPKQLRLEINQTKLKSLVSS